VRIGPNILPGLATELDVVSVEVWGCGGAKADRTQSDRKAVGAAIQQSSAKAKRLDWEVERDMLVMAGGSVGNNLSAGEAGRIAQEMADGQGGE
jgi:hypothetical protein